MPRRTPRHADTPAPGKTRITCRTCSGTCFVEKVVIGFGERRNRMCPRCRGKATVDVSTRWLDNQILAWDRLMADTGGKVPGHSRFTVHARG